MRDQGGFNILRIDASARRDHSITRQLGDTVTRRLLREHPQAAVTRRDLAIARREDGRLEGAPDDDGTERRR